MLKLTDGVDDAAVSVASSIQGGQLSDGPLGQFVLQKEETLTGAFVLLTFCLPTSKCSTFTGAKRLPLYIAVTYHCTFSTKR